MKDWRDVKGWAVIRQSSGRLWSTHSLKVFMSPGEGFYSPSAAAFPCDAFKKQPSSYLQPSEWRWDWVSAAANVQRCHLQFEIQSGAAGFLWGQHVHTQQLSGSKWFKPALFLFTWCSTSLTFLCQSCKMFSIRFISLGTEVKHELNLVEKIFFFFFTTSKWHKLLF